MSPPPPPPSPILKCSTVVTCLDLYSHLAVCSAFMCILCTYKGLGEAPGTLIHIHWSLHVYSSDVTLWCMCVESEVFVRIRSKQPPLPPSLLPTPIYTGWGGGGGGKAQVLWYVFFCVNACIVIAISVSESFSNLCGGTAHGYTSMLQTHSDELCSFFGLLEVCALFCFTGVTCACGMEAPSGETTVLSSSCIPLDAQMLVFGPC